DFAHPILFHPPSASSHQPAPDNTPFSPHTAAPASRTYETAPTIPLPNKIPPAPTPPSARTTHRSADNPAQSERKSTAAFPFPHGQIGTAGNARNAPRRHIAWLN